MASPTHELTKPTIHLNGSDAATLAQGYMDAAAAIRSAQQVLDQTAPNARDYYVQGPDAFGLAAAQHRDRVARLQGVFDELMALARHARQHERARG